MSIVHTEALVIKSVPFQETSRIVRLFTREMGKVAVIAKGARRLKSQFRGYLEPLNLLDIIYYHKDSREVQTLSKVELRQSCLQHTAELSETLYALVLVEAVDKFIRDHHQDAAVFDLSVEVLEYMDRERSQLPETLIYFLLRLTDLLGYAVSMEQCAICNRSLTAAIYNQVNGHLLCEDCGHYLEHFTKLGVEETGYMKKASRWTSSTEIRSMPLDAKGLSLILLLTDYLRFHTDLPVQMKSLQMLAGILDPETNHQ